MSAASPTVVAPRMPPRAAPWRSWRRQAAANPISDAIREGRLAVAHRLWPSARAGDDAAAVGVALDFLEAGVDGPGLDLAMTALVPLARGGNAAAQLVLDHAARPRTAP